jgi:hypothetical protein
VDLLRNLFGNLTSGIIRLAVTAGVLFLVYLFLLKPVLDTTNKAIEKSGFDRIGRSIDDVSKRVQRQVHRSFDSTKPGARRQKLVRCVQRASGNVHKIQRCARRF